VSVDALRGLAQPDQRSCGPSSLVAAHMLIDPAYAATITPQVFAAEVLSLHRWVTSASASRLPWPRALGTPPWAVAAAMTGFAGVRYASTLVPFHDRARLFGRLQRAVATRPAPFYVGDWIPRHVVLAVAPTADGVQVYNPARGTVGELLGSDFAAGRLTTFGRWVKPWFVVLPTGAR
jgi:hypothetical protein